MSCAFFHCRFRPAAGDLDEEPLPGATGVVTRDNRQLARLPGPEPLLLGKLHLPEVVSNLTFGGPKRNDLYITATSSVYSVRLNTTGARYPAGAR
jgi:hypothetical protein